MIRLPFDKLVIDADKYQFIVKKSTGFDEEGKETWADYKYFKTFGGCMKYVTEYMTKMKIKSKDIDFADAMAEYKRIAEELEALVLEVKGTEE